MSRIYLDNAATSWPKPEKVYEAVDRYLREVGAPAGRGAYREAEEVERAIADARLKAARLIGCDEPRRIVFTQNGTDSLNLALHGLLRQGDHVVTTAAEHNSVLRPLRWLEEHRDVAVTRIDCDGVGRISPDDIRGAMRSNTRLVAVTHVSNVTGVIQPVAEVGRITCERNIRLLVDAAQSLGHFPFTAADLRADLIAAPTHKGLLGPLGGGLLYVGRGVEDELASHRQGGTGTQSDDDRQPESLPDKYESGNLNVPALVGLRSALEFLEERGLESIRRHDVKLTEKMLAGFASIAGVSVYGPARTDDHVGVVSITLEGYDSREVAAMLDAAASIQTRPGLHCAPLIHRAMKTDACGGTVRFSHGPFTTENEIEAAIEAVSQIAASSMEFTL